MADEIEKVVGHIAHVGLRRLPVFAMIEDAVKPFLPAGADERLRAAVEADTRDAFVRLQLRVDVLEGLLGKHGHRLDDLGAKRTVAVAQEVAKGIAGSYGEPKVEAVLNAGARQFDPTMGPQEVRKYWLDRVTQLQDLEVRVLILLKDFGPLFYFSHPGYLHWGASREPANLPAADRVALGSTLFDLHQANELVMNDQATAEIENYSTRGSALTARGEQLVRFIQPIDAA